MTNIFIIGRSGRMGKLVEEEAIKAGHNVVGGIDLNNNHIDFDMGIDIVIDFSLPTVLSRYLDDLITHKIPVISGTTGLTDEQLGHLHKAAEFIPIMYATNYSIGVNTLLKLVNVATKFLKDRSEIEIIEKHHRYKKDAPSGTALTLGKTIADGMDKNFDEIAGYGRKETDGSRKDELVFHSLRGGNIIGEHSVQFILDNEIVELRHEALNRSIFAQGAVSAIPFLMKKSKGFYHIQDLFE